MTDDSESFWNPYLDEVLELGDLSVEQPFAPPGLRLPYIQQYAFAIPNEEAIHKIAEIVREEGAAGIIEIGAGSGYWAEVISQLGVEVLAFDANEKLSKDGKTFPAYIWTRRWFNVQRGGVGEIEKHPDHVLFLCWPSYSSDMGVRCLETYEGRVFIYIGEGEGGCCANDRFFELLEDEFELEESVYIPGWAGLNDRLYIYTRKDT